MSTFATVASDVTVLAQLNENSADGLRDLILSLVAAIVFAIMVVKMAVLAGDNRYGSMVGVFGACTVIIGFCVFPEQGMSVMTGLWSTLFGDGGAA